MIQERKTQHYTVIKKKIKTVKIDPNFILRSDHMCAHPDLYLNRTRDATEMM